MNATTTPLPTRALALATALRDAGRPTDADKLAEIARIALTFGPDVLRDAVRVAERLMERRSK